MLRTSFLLQKLQKGSYSVNIVDRVTILALSSFAHGPLSTYQVLFESLVYLSRYAPDKLFIAKIKTGSNFVNTVDRVMVLALCTSTDSPLSMYEFPCILSEIYSGQAFNCKKLKGK